jgi:hypothetical protein
VVSLSRRGLLGAGALGALAVAGCGNEAPKAPTGGHAAVLGTLLAAQRVLADAWQHVDRDVAARERAHVSALTAAGAASDRPAPGAVERAARRVRSPGDREALLAAERAAGAALLTALPEVHNANSRALVMSQYAASAQHASLLLTALGRDPLPDAFAGTLT